MKVKGRALCTLPEFIVRKFGSDGLSRWLNTLDPEARWMYKGSFSKGRWYPYEELGEVPIRRMCELFYSGDLRGAREGGRYGAEMAFKGFARFLVKNSAPEALVYKAGTLWARHYRPSEVRVISREKGKVVVYILPSGKGSPFLENRFAGYLERVLELGGRKKVKVRICRSTADGHPYTELEATWV